jgi:hypothetical protein
MGSGSPREGYQKCLDWLVYWIPVDTHTKTRRICLGSITIRPGLVRTNRCLGLRVTQERLRLDCGHKAIVDPHQQPNALAAPARFPEPHPWVSFLPAFLAMAFPPSPAFGRFHPRCTPTSLRSNIPQSGYPETPFRITRCHPYMELYYTGEPPRSGTRPRVAVINSRQLKWFPIRELER